MPALYHVQDVMERPIKINNGGTPISFLIHEQTPDNDILHFVAALHSFEPLENVFSDLGLWSKGMGKSCNDVWFLKVPANIKGTQRVPSVLPISVDWSQAAPMISRVTDASGSLTSSIRQWHPVVNWLNQRELATECEVRSNLLWASVNVIGEGQTAFPDHLKLYTWGVVTFVQRPEKHSTSNLHAPTVLLWKWTPGWQTRELSCHTINLTVKGTSQLAALFCYCKPFLTPEGIKSGSLDAPCN
eukprot:jgi/Psemu1/28461/gm1.28461_g